MGSSSDRNSTVPTAVLGSMGVNRKWLRGDTRMTSYLSVSITLMQECAAQPEPSTSSTGRAPPFATVKLLSPLPVISSVGRGPFLGEARRPRWRPISVAASVTDSRASSSATRDTAGGRFPGGGLLPPPPPPLPREGASEGAVGAASRCCSAGFLLAHSSVGDRCRARRPARRATLQWRGVEGGAPTGAATDRGEAVVRSIRDMAVSLVSLWKLSGSSRKRCCKICCW
mmetsp:Transcript_33556/g.85732  ORF Transcript_33556/g.85732 Transcript_33556/m.85732 type:complete len:228 (+) Transcript_33556:1529-2212(+)